MKLRIKGDSLRLRLTRTEVLALVQAGEVEEGVHIAPGVQLCYGVCANEEPGLAVTWEGDKLCVGIPHDWLAGWSEDDRVGFEGQQDAGNGRTLSILVEKDYACLHKRPDEDDAYPHPEAASDEAG